MTNIIKKLVLLAVLAGIGFGGYWYYTNNTAQVHGWFGGKQETAETISDTSTAADHKDELESQLED